MKNYTALALLALMIAVVAQHVAAEPMDFINDLFGVDENGEISSETVNDPTLDDFGGPGIGKFRNCTSTKDCTPTKDCSQSHDTRNCKACILKNPFGGCALKGNDPICEVSKAAQNAVYAAKKASCEAEKSTMKARCEADKTANKLDCERLKQTQIFTAEIYEAAIHRSKEVAFKNNPRLIPDAIKETLKEEFRKETLDRVRWTDGWSDNLSVQKYAIAYNGKAAITFDNIIVFKSEALANSDLGLWAHELEHVKQFQLLGIDGFAQYYTHKEGTIESLATKQSKYVCDQLVAKGVECYPR